RINSAATISHHTTVGTAAVKRLLSHKKTFFYNTACSERLALGEIAAHGQPYHTLTLAFDTTSLQQLVAFNTEQGVANTLMPTVETIQSLLGGAGYETEQSGTLIWSRSERLVPDVNQFFVPISYYDAMEQQSVLQWDNEKMLPVKVTDPMGLASALVNNYRLMRPYKITDPNGMNHVFEFNGLGMVTRSIVQGASGEGDTVDSPTISYSYNLHNWMEHQLPVVAGVSAREVHGSANSRWLTSYTWSDGLGRELQTKVQAEDGDAFTIVNGSVVSVTTDNRWVATGRTVYNNKGKVIKQYEPWFSASDQYEPEDELCRYGVTPLMTYDPLGRLIRTDFPDGTISRVEFDSWKQKNFDRNDCVANSSWYAVMSIGSVAQQRAASLTMLHNNTPQVIDLDTLGRPVRVTDDNGAAGSYSTYSRLDILGRITQVTDAKGRLITRHFYSIDG
ncbi:MAG TPA: RHS repeat protein, partial [Candidatus Cloacimonadota bacterium]|nr:RHS repeat protein [Candidatus Cloacimonadota bacterium]